MASPRSQNGYAANDRGACTSIAVPGGTLVVRSGPVAQFFSWLAGEYHRRVEPLLWPGCWGYAERPIRGQTAVLSNHASGTAVDFGAPLHPLGKRGTFTGKAAVAVRALADEVAAVCRWGGDYRERPDEMHWEIVCSEAALIAWLAARARQQAPAGVVLPACPGTTRQGMTNSGTTRAFQQRLKDRGWSIAVDGDHGPGTSKVLAAFQAEKGLTPDGVGGPGTWKALWS